MRNATREELLEALERGAEVVETRSHQPVKYQPRSENDRKPWTVYEPIVRKSYHLSDDEVSVTADQPTGTAGLAPLSAFDDAMAQARRAAVQALSLVSVTLHRQFPTGAHLVLKRPIGDYDDDTLVIDSVRDAQGETVRQFNPVWLTSDRLPDVPAELAALWGDTDPQKPEEVLGLLQRVDELSRYTFFDFLPGELWTDEEVEEEGSGGRTPLGLRLAAEHCPEHGPMCEPDDHVEPPTAP